MADSPENNAGDGEKAEPEAIKASARSTDSDLPVVESPKLGAGEEEVASAIIEPSPVETMHVETLAETPIPPDAEEAAPAEPARSFRFALLAATIALAAGIGSFLGSLSASGIERLLPAAHTAGTDNVNVSEAVQAMKAQLAQLTAIKTHLDDTARTANGQFAKIADHLDRLDKLATIAAPETTGSIGSRPPPATTAPVQPLPPVVDGWVVQDVQNGRALVENRNGGVFDVAAGSIVPGLGRVDAIKRQEGEWIVLTARGTITSGH